MRTWWPRVSAAGAGIALLLALPTLRWQARNGWPQLRPVREQTAVWRCTGRREPWPELWPRLRHLDVG
ncbi:hypothetical protein [Nocardia jiangsuensis]|uniref:Uncharacterized protein n=1 Tax=Nocardia jiangsuensis TaxID=1691563 RepID=A0ABV8DN69_9NOCA